MANDLTDATTDTTRAAPRDATPPGACWHCRLGNHTLCTGVGCLPLCDVDHPRKPGVTGLADEPLVRSGERPQGDATAHRPAHTRGGRR